MPPVRSKRLEYFFQEKLSGRFQISMDYFPSKKNRVRFTGKFPGITLEVPW